MRRRAKVWRSAGSGSASRIVVRAASPPHPVRARRYLEAHPGDLVGLGRLLGHSDLTTTGVYAQPTADDLAARLDRLPLNAYEEAVVSPPGSRTEGEGQRPLYLTEAGVRGGTAVRARKSSVESTSAVELESTTRAAWWTSSPDMPPWPTSR